MALNSVVAPKERANFCNQRAIALCNINEKDRERIVGRVDLQLRAQFPRFVDLLLTIIIQMFRGIEFKFPRSV